MSDNFKIPMGVVGGGAGMMDAGGAPHPGNPMGALQGMLETGKHLTELRNLQLTQQARLKAGQIIAHSPSMEAAQEELRADPLISAMYPDALSNAVSVNNAMLTGQKQSSELRKDGLGTFLSNLPAAINDMKQYDVLRANTLRVTAPSARKDVAEAIDGIKESLDAVNTGDPKADAEARARIMAGLAISNGAEGAVKALYPEFKPEQVGSNIVPLATQKPFSNVGGGAPGEVLQAPGSIPVGIAPANVPIGQAQSPGTPGGNRINPLMPKGAATAPGFQTGPAQSPTQAPPPRTAPLAEHHEKGETAGDGQPLVPDDYEMLSPAIGYGTGTGGANILSPAQQRQVDDLSHEYQTEGKSTFRNAQRSMGLLEEMDRNFDKLRGTSLEPGPMTDVLVSSEKLANQVSKLLGVDETPFDQPTLANAEDLMKGTQRMGLAYLTTALGSQREAAETIRNITQKGVPGIENTYLGGKLLVASIRAATQREIDLRKWQTEWQGKPKNQGSLIGAEEAFNEKHPAEGYIDKVLNAFGMSREAVGFKSVPDVIKAMNDHMLTREQASTIIKERFPDFKGE